MLATAHEEGLIRSNPAAGLRIAQRIQPEADAEQAKALTPAELRCLLAELPPAWRLFVEFLAHTGLRISEAVALRWGDIDFGHSRVQVRRRLYLGNLAPPKSRFGRRDIPLTAGMTRRHNPLALGTPQAPGCHPRGTLFPSKTGAPLDPSNVFSPRAQTRRQTRRRALAGFHTLRHTCATMRFRQGYNAKQVQVWLGHHSPAFTLATYVHLLPDDLPQPQFLDQLTAPSPTGTEQPGDGAASAAVTPPTGGNEVATRPSENRRDDRPTARPQTAEMSAFTR